MCGKSQIIVGLSEEQALQASHWTCSARQDVQGAHEVIGLIRRKHILPLCFAHKIDLAMASMVMYKKRSPVQDCMDSAMASGNQDLVWKLRNNYGNSTSWPTESEASLDDPRLKACWSTSWRKTWRQAWPIRAWGWLCCIFDLLQDRGQQKKRLDLIWAKRGFHISFFFVFSKSLCPLRQHLKITGQNGWSWSFRRTLFHLLHRFYQ